MYAKINGSEAVNVHQVVMVKVVKCTSEGLPDKFGVDFFNNAGKVIARSYLFDGEKEAWKFVGEVISDGARRDLKRFVDVEIKNGEKSGE